MKATGILRQRLTPRAVLVLAKRVANARRAKGQTPRRYKLRRQMLEREAS